MWKNVVIAVLTLAVIGLSVVTTGLYFELGNQKTLLAAANTKLTAATAQVSSLNDQVSTLTNQLATCQANSAPDTRLDVQGITVGFAHPDMFSNESGEIATITNHLSDSLAIHVEATRPGTDQSWSHDYVLDQDKPQEIGETEGWAFVSGDVLTISESGYKSLEWTVPK